MTAKYQLLPPPSPREFAALLLDIQKRGILMPVEMDENGDILDGHSRKTISDELGIECPTVLVELPNEEEKMAYAIRVNLARRHLSPEQTKDVEGKQKRIALSLKMPPLNYSQEMIAEVLGVTRQSVSLWLGNIASACNVSVPDLRLKIPREDRDHIVVRVEDGETPDSIASEYKVTPKRVQQIYSKHLRDLEAKLRGQQLLAAAATKPVVIRCAAVEFLCEVVEEKSVDLLFTDPPYATDVENINRFAGEWVPLALSRLKDSGRGYIFTGAYPNELQAYLDVLLSQDRFVVGNVLVWTYRNTLGPAPKLDYKLNWQACFYLRGPKATPLSCPQMTEQFAVQDVNAPDARTGIRRHEWEKPEELAERLIRHSLPPGGVVVDPFSGTGTFLAVAAKLGAVAIGCEIDDTMIALCEERGITFDESRSTKRLVEECK